MAICVDSALIHTGETVDACTAFIVLQGGDWGGVTLQDIFQIPVAADIASAWMAGFALPMIVYLSAWAYGYVINWFNDKE